MTATASAQHAEEINQHNTKKIPPKPLLIHKTFGDNIMKILFIGHSYHKKTGSSKFFISHLQKIGDIEFLWDEEWTPPFKKLELGDLSPYAIIIIWQVPHIARRIPKEHFNKTVYVPMYDAVARIGARFWRKLRGMRIVCFSQDIYIKCLTNKLEAFLIQYYPEPKKVEKSFDELSVFFWQRQTSPNWRTLCGDVPVAQFDRIHLHGAVDPGNGDFIEPLECEKKLFNVSFSTWFNNPTDYFDTLEKHNVFVAPRKEEGIGMALLEAMQRGMVCIANDAPTMNEYIVHGMNGYLTPTPFEYPIALQRDDSLSKRALESIKIGHQRYEIQMERLNTFLLAQGKPKFRKFITPLINKIKNGNAVKQIKKNIERIRGFRTQAILAPTITIITVVRNDAEGLMKTILSIAEQTSTNFEHIIIDGKSTDATKDIISQIPASFSKVVSEADTGPYDAMNKGAKLAQGEFVLFLNAGDTLFSPETIEFLLMDINHDADIIYGHHVYHPNKGGQHICRANWLPHTFTQLKQGDISYKWLSGIPCHQATLTKRSSLIARPYNHQQFSIAADHDFLFEALSSNKKTHHTNLIISNYYGGGYSSRHTATCVENWKTIALKHTSSPEKVSSFYDSGNF